MNLTAAVKEIAASNDMDFIGFAPASRLDAAPKDRKPRDLLPGVQSVVSMGVKIRRGVAQANRQAYGGVRHAIYVYMMFGYSLLNEKLNTAALRVSKLLEEQGFTSVPMPASPPMDYEQLMGALSHRHAAVAAGLGEFGWNTLLVTPEWGPRVRLVTVLTEAKLDSTPMYSGERICDPDKCGRLCQRMCPMNAFGEGSEKLEIGGRVFEYAKLDHYRCYCGVEGLTSGTLARKSQDVPVEVGPEEYLRAIGREDAWQRKEMASGGSFCGRCIVHCPVGLGKTGV